jgi:hypothetical protein
VSRLKGRVASMGAKQPPATAGTRASGTASPPGMNVQPGGAGSTVQPGTAARSAKAVPAAVSGSAASPPSVMTMPLQLVTVTPAQSQYVTLGAQDLTPIWGPMGEGIPATAPGRWGQLRAAGRP